MRNSVSVAVRNAEEVIEYFEKDKGESCHLYKDGLSMDCDELVSKVKSIAGDKEVTISSFKDSYVIKVFEKKSLDIPEYTLPPKLDRKDVHGFIAQLYKSYENREGIRLTKEQFSTLFGKTQCGLAEKEIDKIGKCLGVYITTRPWSKKAGITAFISGTIPQFENIKKAVIPAKVKSGVYLISDGEFQKIGITSDIDKRLAALQTSNARQLKVVEIYKSKNAEILETNLHKYFNEYRLKGEWFNLSLSKEEFINTCSSLENTND